MNKARLEEIIRVDHAGEHGATSIYKGTPVSYTHLTLPTTPYV